MPPLHVTTDMVKEIGREIGLRKALYPKWVKGGRMPQSLADRQLAAVEAVYAYLKERMKIEEKEYA